MVYIDVVSKTQKTQNVNEPYKELKKKKVKICSLTFPLSFFKVEKKSKGITASLCLKKSERSEFNLMPPLC